MTNTKLFVAAIVLSAAVFAFFHIPEPHSWEYEKSLNRIEQAKQSAYPENGEYFYLEVSKGVYRDVGKWMDSINDNKERQVIADSLLVFPAPDAKSLRIKIEGLGSMMGEFPEVEEYVIGHLQSGDQEVAKAVIDQMVKWGRLDEVQDRIDDLQYYGWASKNSRILERHVLIRALLHAPSEERTRIGFAIERTNSPVVLPASIDSLLLNTPPDNDLETSWMIYQVLHHAAKSPDKNHVEWVLPFIHDSLRAIREEALGIVLHSASYRNRPAVQALEDIAENHPDPAMRERANWFLTTRKR
ncbi:hypothetical protein KQI63_15320 [bacterium]|nr:hypothetical protein [bacterium]